MADFTKGSLYIEAGSEDLVFDDSGALIGKFYGPDAQANAQLFAGAADMHAALTELVAQHHKYTSATSVHPDSAIFKAIKALAKVDGT